FQSDHGHSTEERAHFGGGSAGPFRGAKFSFFEGGLRVPAIVSWPRELPQGATRDALAHGCDWLPTLASLCGVEPPAIPLDGRDLSEVRRSPDAASPHSQREWRSGDRWAVLEHPWKLIHRPNPA